MSVVVAIKENDTVYVGCDSQVTSGYTKATLTKQKKIWKPSDDKDIVMGLVGSFRDANILSTADNWVDELTKTKNSVDFKYIVRKVTKKVFSELNEFGRVENKNNISSLDSEIVFAYKDQAYLICTDGAVLEMDDILATGSGTRLCIGAWNSVKNNSDLTVKEKLVHVIKAACESDLYVNYPIIIMNTANDTVDVIDFK